MNLAYFSLTDTGQRRESSEDYAGLDTAHPMAVMVDGRDGYIATRCQGDRIERAGVQMRFPQR